MYRKYPFPNPGIDDMVLTIKNIPVTAIAGIHFSLIEYRNPWIMEMPKAIAPKAPKFTSN